MQDWALLLQRLSAPLHLRQVKPEAAGILLICAADNERSFG